MNLIEQWAQSMGLAPLNAQRKLSLTVDQVRLHVLEVQPGQLAIEARICEVPTLPAARERTMERVLKIALGRARDSDNHLMVDDEQSAFWLQKRISALAPVQALDKAVEDLVNDIELWRQAL
jgi:hypothetical protein